MKQGRTIASALLVTAVLVACGDDEATKGTTTPVVTDTSAADESAVAPAVADTTAATASDDTNVTSEPVGPSVVATDQGVDETTIKVGLLTDMSGPIAFIGNAYVTGAHAFYAQLSARGGVCGRTVEVVEGDTKYDPQVAVQAYRGVKDDVVALTQITGAATVFGLANDIAKDGLASIAGTDTSAVLGLENVFLTGTPAPSAAINGVAYAAENLAGDDDTLQLGIIYQDDAYGQEGLDAVNFAAERLPNVEIVASAGYATSDQDFTAQVQSMKDSGAEVVWLHDSPRQTPPILGVASQLGYTPTFIGNAGSWSPSLAAALTPAELEHFLLDSSNPMWGEDTVGMTEMLAALDQYAPNTPPDDFTTGGYKDAKILTAALEAACESGDLTRAGVVAAFETVDVKMEGLGPDVVLTGAEAAQKVPTHSSRINSIDPATGAATPITDWLDSDIAKEWVYG